MFFSMVIISACMRQTRIIVASRNIYLFTSAYSTITPGGFFLSVNHGERVEAEGAFAFTTHPGVFEYGSFPGESRHHNFICSYGEKPERAVCCQLMT